MKKQTNKNTTCLAQELKKGQASFKLSNRGRRKVEKAQLNEMKGEKPRPHLWLACYGLLAMNTTQLPPQGACCGKPRTSSGIFYPKKWKRRRGGKNSPATHQFYSRIHMSLTQREDRRVTGENSLKISFLLKRLFPRHCETDCCQPFSRTNHTMGIWTCHTLPGTLSQLVSSLKSLLSLDAVPGIGLVLEGVINFCFL